MYITLVYIHAQGWNSFHINHNCIQAVKKPQISIENFSLVQGTSNKRAIIVVNTQNLIIKRMDFRYNSEITLCVYNKETSRQLISHAERIIWTSDTSVSINILYIYYSWFSNLFVLHRVHIWLHTENIHQLLLRHYVVFCKARDACSKARRNFSYCLMITWLSNCLNTYWKWNKSDF